MGETKKPPGKCLLALFPLLLLALAQTGQAQTAPIVTNSADMTFAAVPAGRFTMGAGPGFKGDGEYERPAHDVTIPRAFRLGRAEVTVDQWNRVMANAGTGGDRFRKGKGDLPIDNVSWQDAMDFAARLNEREGVKKYRLPTEAEWEYAARAGTATAYYFGDDPAAMGDYAWCGGGFARGSPSPGQAKKPNALGLYDMLGNLSEWVSDWFAPDYYAQRVGHDPKGPPGGEEKVHRGGAFASDPKSCQSAWRESDLPSVRSLLIGFRLAYDE
ncbi:MAG: formylglycine-generating enzyme family protein [Deltaproteobacteria bacterium]|jgi:formylglycine-generating enzyme required for sulfatase activity|nr:formylglycine-generating enzyme family protein [Deltaproteobacteria bacterium]